MISSIIRQHSQHELVCSVCINSAISDTLKFHFQATTMLGCRMELTATVVTNILDMDDFLMRSVTLPVRVLIARYVVEI